MTRPSLVAAAVLLLALPAATQAQPRAAVSISVTDLRSTEGQLVVCLWRERRGFPTCEEGDGVPRRTYPVTARTMRVTLPLPEAGQYAVTVFHDENQNGRLNQNFIGMPTEGVAVSNNPGGMPRFAPSLVTLEPGSTVSVRMRYLFD
jgi:uncharacterized protein (DUF2141 family)